MSIVNIYSRYQRLASAAKLTRSDHFVRLHAFVSGMPAIIQVKVDLLSPALKLF